MFPIQKPEMTDNIAVARLLETGLAMFQGEKYSELAVVLSALRGLAILHQTHHWQASGPTSYSDHLLFERLYNDIQPDIDSTAEKLVGLNKGAMVMFTKHVIGLSTFLKSVKEHSTSDDLTRISLEAELLLLSLIETVMDRLKVSGLLTRGLEQHLGNIADKHETAVYLLKRRITG